MARAIAVGGIAIFLHAVENLVFDLRISHGIGQVRLYESRRNARYAQLVPGSMRNASVMVRTAFFVPALLTRTSSLA